MMKKKLRLSLLFLSSLLLLAGCSLPGLASTSDNNTVAITGGITSEAQILGSIVADMVEHYIDRKINVISSLATTTINHQAILNRDASISAARYTDTDVATMLGLPTEEDPEKAFNLVQSEFEKRYQQAWFPPYGSENIYVLLIIKETAGKHNLKTVSDLGKVTDELVADVDTAWIIREGDGYEGSKREYNFQFKSILPMQINLVYDAVNAGKMDVTLGYSTDGRIGSYDSVMLKDNKRFSPPYDAAPVVSDKLLKETLGIRDALNRSDGRISTKKMQELNYQADNDLIEPAVVAERFLEENNYFEGE